MDTGYSKKEVERKTSFPPGRLNFSGLLALAVLTFTGCRVGGQVTAFAVPAPSPVPIVKVPTIAVPASSPYYSNGNSVTITGMCMMGQIVRLAGDALAQQVCPDASSYSFTIERTTDGVYSFAITQMDELNNISTPVSFVWVRKTSVPPPSILTPATNPFFSAQASLTISGHCETGNIISLSGGAVGSTSCLQSAYSLSVPKNVDGSYSVQVTQTDLAGNSSSTSLVWNKQALRVSPSSSVLLVNSSQSFTISGGSGSYTFSLLTNRSGGSLNTATNTYTTGIKAGVVDVLQVTDSQGISATVNITTVANIPDHLVIVSGDGQNQTIGSILSNKAKVQVVDQYGNGLPGFSLYFEITAGDAELISSPVQVTNSGGFAEVSLRLGYTSILNRLTVQPLWTPLPDVAGTGNAEVVFTQTAASTGNGNLGLSFLVGTSPSGLVHGDFNQDQHQDLAVLNVGDNSVGILLGIGNGLYGNMRSTLLGGCIQASDVATGDFNEDGAPDLAISCQGNDSIALLMGNGDGTFRPVQLLSTVPGPVAIAASDLNNDGVLELIAVSFAGDLVGIHFGEKDASKKATGAFAAPVNHATGRSPVAIAIADLDKDGLPDLVLANSGINSISVLMNKGSGNFDPPLTHTSGAGPVVVATADFNGDGYPDVITANSADNTLSVLLNDKTGALEPHIDTPVGNGPNALAAMDLNGDGKADVLVLNGSDSTITRLVGTGAGTLVSVDVSPVSTGPVALSLFDSNEDGELDLFIATQALQLIQEFPGRTGGEFGVSTLVGEKPWAVSAADFDADGKQDLAVVNERASSVMILLGSGNGLLSLKTALLLPAESSPSALAVDDFNRDGKKDLAVVSSATSAVSIFIGKGDGTFESRVDYSTASYPTGVVIKDLNQDGYLDLAVSNKGSSTVSVFLGNGDGTFKGKVDWATASNPVGIAAADFNRDGVMDLASVNNTDGSVSILLGNGDGTYQPRQDYAVGLLPVAITVGDFNSDLNPDIAVANSGDGTISVLLARGDGSLQTQQTYSSGESPSSVTTADFNGDGKLDIAVANGTAQSIGLMQGLGNGSFIAAAPIAAHANLSALAVCDMNGDTKVDLAVLDISENAVQMWLGQ